MSPSSGWRDGVLLRPHAYPAPRRVMVKSEATRLRGTGDGRFAAFDAKTGKSTGPSSSAVRPVTPSTYLARTAASTSSSRRTGGGFLQRAIDGRWRHGVCAAAPRVGHVARLTRHVTNSKIFNLQIQEDGLCDRTSHEPSLEVLATTASKLSVVSPPPEHDVCKVRLFYSFPSRKPHARRCQR